MMPTASLPFDIAVAVLSMAAVLCLLSGVTPWWRRAVAGCRAVRSLAARLVRPLPGWGWTALWVAAYVPSWALVRLRPRPGHHCAPAGPPAAAVPPPGPFLPAPRPANAAESMTPLGPNTATDLACIRPWIGRDRGWE